MRTTFSTPVTPTRERLTWVEGRRAWTSLPRSVAGSFMGLWTIPTRRQRPGSYARWTFVQRLSCKTRQNAQVVVLWPESAVCPVVLPPPGQPLAVLPRPPPITRLSIAHRPRRLNAVSKERGLTEKHEAAVGLLEEPTEAAFMDIEELRSLASEGRERGFLTFEEIGKCLEE